MNEMLRDLSPARIIIAIEENLSAWIPVFGKLGKAYVNDPVGLSWSITDYPLSLFNSIMDARLESEQVEPYMRPILAEAKKRNVPLLFWTGPSSRPAHLEDQLEKLGFRFSEESPGMAVELRNLPENMPELEGFSIQLAKNEAEWRLWSQTMALGYEAPASASFLVDAWHDLMCVADPEMILAYTGWLNGKPVATSLLLLAAGVAGIYAVSTVPEARRRGIGAQMTWYPLLQARNCGYHVGILGASEMGFPVYRALGFQEYCKIREYRWHPEG